jgi:hypothetical protein
LQGLLIVPNAPWPLARPESKAIESKLDQLVRQLNRRSRIDLCLSYARGLSWVDSVIIGFHSEDQFIEITEYFGAKPLLEREMTEAEELIGILPDSLLNPALWPKK